MPDKYERDDDSVEETLKKTHETIGMLTTLLDVLGKQINDLEQEIIPRRKGTINGPGESFSRNTDSSGDGTLGAS